MTPIESLPAKWPDRIVLWSRGVSPHWYFVAAKSERPDIKGSPVYETLDPIVLKGSPEALAAQPQDGELLALADDLRNGGLSEEPTNEFLRGLRAGKRHAADMIESLASRRVDEARRCPYCAGRIYTDAGCQNCKRGFSVTAALQPDSGEDGSA